MEDSEKVERTQPKKSHLKRNLIWIGIGLFILVALLMPNEKKDTTKHSTETTQQKKAEPSKPAVRTIWSDGTYEIGKDIQVGKYKSEADNCYWMVSNDANGTDIVSNNLQSGQQIVELTTPGQYFTVQRCNFKLAY